MNGLNSPTADKPVTAGLQHQLPHEELVDYLLNQSKFHDFNREMVYQLLLDIIDPKNVKEFLLRRR